MSYVRDEWLSRCLKLWVVWLAAGAICYLVPQLLGLGDTLGRGGTGQLWEYPAGIGPQIIGVPALLWGLTMVGNVEPYRVLAIGLGCGAALVHLLVTTYGLPAVQLVYIGLAATAPRLTTVPGRSDIGA